MSQIKIDNSAYGRLKSLLGAMNLDQAKPWLDEAIADALDDYSNWLHKKGYIDADYYAEEPKAVDAYLEELKKKQ